MHFYVLTNINLLCGRLVYPASYLKMVFSLIQPLLRHQEPVKIITGRFYAEFAYNWQLHRRTFKSLRNPDLTESLSLRMNFEKMSDTAFA